MRDIRQVSCDMAKYRLRRADEDLASAKRNLKDNDFRTAVNRSYYAIFHALRAVLLSTNSIQKSIAG